MDEAQVAAACSGAFGGLAQLFLTPLLAMNVAGVNGIELSYWRTFFIVWAIEAVLAAAVSSGMIVARAFSS